VMVRQATRYEDGVVVVALTEEEATVKRIYDEGIRWRLQPENPRLAPTFVRKSEPHFRVLGRVVAVLKLWDVTDQDEKPKRKK